MCGIVGLIKKTGYYQPTPHKEIFTNLVYIDAIRGFDSTGIAGIDAKGEVQVFKKALAAWDFLQLKQTEKILRDTSDFQFMIGHNRYMTRGNVTDPNAHPFQHNHITLVHNGTINNWKTLFNGRNEEVEAGAEVDSHGVAVAFSVIGVEETIARIAGGFTLVWHDARDNSLNMVRNEDKPLWVMPVKDAKSTIIFASERGMLYLAAERNQLDVADIHSLTVGEVWKFKVGDKIEWSRHPVDFYKPTSYSTTSRVGGTNGTDWTSSATTRGTTTYNNEFTKAQRKFLKRNNLEVGRDCRFTFEDFVAYNSSTNPSRGRQGYILGMAAIEDEYVEVRVHGVEECDFEKMLDKTVPIHGTISTINYERNRNARPGEDSGYFIVYIERQTFCQHYAIKSQNKRIMNRLDLRGVLSHTEIADDTAATADDATGTDKELLHPTRGSAPANLVLVEDRTSHRGPNGRWISTLEWTALVKEGCKSCHTTIYKSDEVSRWDGEKPVCKTCADLDIANVACPSNLN